MRLVAPTRGRRGGVVSSRSSAGRCLVAPRGQRRALLRNAGRSLVVESQPGGGACPLEVVLGGVPLRRCRRAGWWRASVGNGAIGAARLCAMPGPFDPVDRRGEGVRLVAFDRRRRRGVLWLWPLVGRSPVVPRLRRRAPLRNARRSLIVGGQRGGGARPLDVVAGGVPSRHCVGVGWLVGACAVPLSRASAAH